LPKLLAFSVGASDSRFRAETVRLDRELTAARVPHFFRLYSGGHSQQLWQREAAAWLRLVVERLARPTTG
jgi:enterochelin esterase-like enzyme